MKDENLFFVGVKDHLELRRELLGNSKNLLSSLKQYEDFIDIKDNKAKLVKELQKVFDDILDLNRKLRSNVPKLPASIGKTMPKQSNNLDVELDKIESRLSSLE